MYNSQRADQPRLKKVSNNSNICYFSAKHIPANNTSMKQKDKAISAKDRSLARHSLKVLRRIAKVHKKQSRPLELKATEDGSELQIPLSAIDDLEKMFKHISQGNPVEVLSQDEIMTTQQAADYLNVSRPFVVKLMESGKIPYSKVGRHRRVAFSDLKKYENQQHRIADQKLRELTQQAQELDLY